MSLFSEMSSSHCGPINPMTSLFKQFGKDSSLQQDRYGFENKGKNLKTDFRSQNHTHDTTNLLTEEFLRDQLDRSDMNMFQFKGLHNELGLIQPSCNNWIAEFSQYKQQNTHQFEEFESIFENHQQRIHASKNNQNWSQEFALFHQREHHAVSWDQEFTAAQASLSDIHQGHTVCKKTTHATQACLISSHAKPPFLVLNDPQEETPMEKQQRFELDCFRTLDYNNNYTFQSQKHDLSTAESTLLALEAKTQQDASNAEAWHQLGLHQQENERDASAIAALRQAVQLDPGLTDAWLALAVSFTNKHCFADTYDALENWITHHPHYYTLAISKGTRRHESITQTLLKAAQSVPGEEMDADVQVALGLLFIISEEYEKAVDCFKAAVMRRPQDPLLWNKLGASLANAGDPYEAIEAYFRALEIKSTYARARYNIAISCITLGQYHEAAEHLLTTLSLRDYRNYSEGVSDNVWGTLRMLMNKMNRDDLVIACQHQDLNAFHIDFEF